MEEKKKTKRVTNAQLKVQVEANALHVEDLSHDLKETAEELREMQLHLMNVQETLIRLVKEWDIRMMQLRDSTEEIAVRVNTITTSISNTVAPADA